MADPTTQQQPEPAEKPQLRHTPQPQQTPQTRHTTAQTPPLEDLLGAAIAAMRTAADLAGLSPAEAEHKIAQTLAFIRRRIEGDYDVDEFGYDQHFAESVYFPALRPLYKAWFRVESRGLDNIPAAGSALVVCNHSGTLPFDALMVSQAVHDEHPARRVLRLLGADLVFHTPFLGPIARRTGSTLATTEDVERLFAQDQLVGVFPEGFKGVGKPFVDRYKLQRFGRGGFVAAALKAGVPIIPTAVVGAEEAAPLLGNISALAKLLRLPYFPVTPTFPLLGPLGLIPLPTKWTIEFGTPIETAAYGSDAADDPMVVFELTDQVRETIQECLHGLLAQRASIFF